MIKRKKHKTTAEQQAIGLVDDSIILELYDFYKNRTAPYCLVLKDDELHWSMNPNEDCSVVLLSGHCISLNSRFYTDYVLERGNPKKGRELLVYYLLRYYEQNADLL